ncbi:MAG TPA: histidinol dehydrogenase [Gammaproteobacteria bacterium]|jgi:phosphoribosyl-ATP pyrophosphohydrolase/phosphoribosyl-AMP cyclohydrolase/histidinol dehydrogenase|nr:histidinol dehydrogenase [Arenicellales bacterium]MDP6792016.1 histidinol dehydrogenase [Arenicellales bacterium]MDP6917622.1 histidinol dehydrogenase [Arenicellales bacterium]HCX88479.1 histidinol dehydrogenase [Gammaproteobacteria bacterium]|tara:strand:+ start:13313 stop:14569 length:1257 start_codon:yes stop_codon:yes gene_type:complete
MATLKIKTLSELGTLQREPVDAKTYSAAVDIVERVRAGGRQALLEEAKRLGDISPGQSITYDRDALESAAEDLDDHDRGVLERTAHRIEAFAGAQRSQLLDLEMEIPGGRAGHTFAPVESAGCYAPGGRFSLPSSVLMTAVTARVAGVERVLVASPKPTPVTLAAAGIAGADCLVALGGAQVIGAMAFGVEGVSACDVIVGPGNRWVTAAKRYVSGYVGIDMLAGPSELVVWADKNADAKVIAADLIAQAEHDTDALPVLVTTSGPLISGVNSALRDQLKSLPGRETAAVALASGYAVLVDSVEEAAQACNRLAPEHLEVHVEDPEGAASGLNHYGTLFLGRGAAEVFGDYGVGPNHVLPTGGNARFSAGLSVLTFLRMRTWMSSGAGPDKDLIRDTAALARLESLEGHARAAEARLG